MTLINLKLFIKNDLNIYVLLKNNRKHSIIEILDHKIHQRSK